MAKLHSALLALFTALLLVTGCSKTVEGETKSWESNNKAVSELMAQYPGMKPALEARLGTAKATFDGAASKSGDDQIKEMAKANSELMGGWVRDLQGLDKELEKLRKSAVEVAAKAGDESSRLGAKVAAEDAQKTVARVEATLKTGAKDDAAAAAVMKKVLADIKTAQGAVDAVASADKDKGEKKAGEEKAATEKVDAEKAAAEAAVADWTCEYCNTPNKHDVTTCSSCGAPRGDKK